MIEKLQSLLFEIADQKPKDFNGLGIVLYDSFEKLSVSPLREDDYFRKLPIVDFDLIVKTLLSISTYESRWHDGFHLISSNFYLTHLSQYFSTPIVQSAPITFNYGSRHRTALYGSYLDGVVACGVISSDFKIVIFQKGKKIVL